MKVRLPHAPYIANKIAIDMLNSGFIKLLQGIEPVAKVSQDILEADIKKEIALEERVDDILDDNDDEIEFRQVDRRSMFWLIKKKLAKEYGVILSYEDRFSELSHQVMDRLWQEDLMDYTVSENSIKNIIYDAIDGYKESFEEVEENVYEKISNMKRKLIPGTDEYEVVFEKLYREELKKKGMF